MPRAVRPSDPVGNRARRARGAGIPSAGPDRALRQQDRRRLAHSRAAREGDSPPGVRAAGPQGHLRLRDRRRTRRLPPRLRLPHNPEHRGGGAHGQDAPEARGLLRAGGQRGRRRQHDVWGGRRRRPIDDVHEQPRLQPHARGDQLHDRRRGPGCLCQRHEGRARPWQHRPGAGRHQARLPRPGPRQHPRVGPGPQHAAGDARPYYGGLCTELPLPQSRRHPRRRIPRADDWCGEAAFPHVQAGPALLVRLGRPRAPDQSHLLDHARGARLGGAQPPAERQVRGDLRRGAARRRIPLRGRPGPGDRLQHAFADGQGGRGSGEGARDRRGIAPPHHAVALPDRRPQGVAAARRTYHRRRGEPGAARGRDAPGPEPRRHPAAPYHERAPPRRHAAPAGWDPRGHPRIAGGARVSTFYDHFERHGKGLANRVTHYCPGCGHGLAHRDLAAAIDELGVQDRTVLISPVGCSVFAYYYFDVGNTQAAHGRAPAVALGHKLANPDAVVISYQGDGDLASIGLAETISIAQLGIPITVIFINNGIYGMTGGQMAPTSLVGQKTSTSPEGRDSAMGQPLRVAELIAQLDGPVYVERVALYDARQRTKARKAIAKALRLQVEGRGYAFVEVLSECPTHLKVTPDAAEAWIRTQMEPVFPLGVKKDSMVEPWFRRPPPSFDAETVLALSGAEPTHDRARSLHQSR